jgi:outer membrane receptor protein involved in Fe transport
MFRKSSWLTAVGSAALVTALTGVWATAAHAQEAGVEVEELVVTAQLREQTVAEVPFALTAFRGEMLEDVGVQDFEDLAPFVPGLEVQNQSPNNPAISIRGITSDSGEATTEPRVSIYQDGVSISRSRGSYVELFDIDRVEVSKGPQSTLYGRGALIGALNIVQNKPDLSGFDASGRASVGDYGYAAFETMFNVPLSDTVAVRLAARVRHLDGYVENALGGRDFNSTDTEAYRASLRFQPSDRLTADLIVNYQEDHPAGTAFRSIAFNPTDPVTGRVLGGRKPADPAALIAGDGFQGGAELGLDRYVWGATGLVRFEINDAFSLNSTTAYREFNSLEVFDADGVSLPALTAAEDARGEQWSQDFRLNFDDGGRLRWFVGLSVIHEEGSQRVPTQFDERVMLARLAGVLNGPIPGRAATDPAPLSVFGSTAFTGALLQGVAGASGVVLSTAQAQAIAANLKPAHREQTTNLAETDSVDIYGDFSFDLTDRIEVGGGLRYTRDDKTSSYRSAVQNERSVLGGFIGALGQPAATRGILLGALATPGVANIPPSAQFPVPLFGLGAQPTTGNGQTFSQDLEDEGFTWRLYGRYALTDDLNLYANYGRGRRPEVLAAGAPSAPDGRPRFTEVDSETVDSVEVGLKGALGAAVTFDAAVFHYKYKNFQTTVQQGTTFVTTNAGEARTYGFEGQLTWALANNFDLFGSYAYNHSRFEAGIRDGNRLRLSPDHTAAIGADFRTPFLGGAIFVRPTATWQSEVFFDDDNDLPGLQQPPRALVADDVQDEVQDGYGLVNLRIGYEAPNADWSIEAFAENLLDEDYLRDAGNTGDGLGLPTFIAGRPRFVGVTFSIRR